MRSLLLIVVVILVAFVGFSYLGGTTYWPFPRTDRPAAVGTTGTIDTQKARERAADVGEKVGVAAAKVGHAVEEVALTSKIKSKMMLDDSVKARTIDVTTNGSVVTLSGTVESPAEHDRAVALARETAGVTRVIDHLTIQR